MKNLEKLIQFTVYLFFTVAFVVAGILFFCWTLDHWIDKEQEEQYLICLNATQDKEKCFKAVYNVND